MIVQTPFAPTSEERDKARETAATVKERRKRIGLSQEQLARKAGCSLGTVRTLERVLPSPSMVARIDAALSELEAQR
jgi:transcriptional regulator with XRE-family HTH domain